MPGVPLTQWSTRDSDNAFSRFKLCLPGIESAVGFKLKPKVPEFSFKESAFFPKPHASLALVGVSYISRKVETLGPLQVSGSIAVKGVSFSLELLQVAFARGNSLLSKQLPRQLFSRRIVLSLRDCSSRVLLSSGCLVLQAFDRLPEVLAVRFPVRQLVAEI
jgi:hypothetical protein